MFGTNVIAMHRSQEKLIYNHFEIQPMVRVTKARKISYWANTTTWGKQNISPNIKEFNIPSTLTGGFNHILTTNDDGSLKWIDGVTEMNKHWYVLQHIGEYGVTIRAFSIIKGIVPNCVSSSLHKLFSELKINVPLNLPLWG